MQKNIYHIMIAAAGNETSALNTIEKAYFLKVVAALNEAIVHRG